MQLHTLQVSEEVKGDRQRRVEAQIVRVMKARQTLRYNDLLEQVTKQVRSSFSVQPKLIKQRLDSLIEREYVERDAGDRNLYHYVP
jgi:cullin 3